MVNITFKLDGVTVDELNPVDFGTVQAGTSSAVKVITVTNTGDSDALLCALDPIEATIANGFISDAQIGTPAETYQSQQFAADVAGPFYNYGVVGTGKNFSNKTGGTLVKTSGTDNYATRWMPPSTGNSGNKVWGVRFSCVYV